MKKIRLFLMSALGTALLSGCTLMPKDIEDIHPNTSANDVQKPETSSESDSQISDSGNDSTASGSTANVVIDVPGTNQVDGIDFSKYSKVLIEEAEEPINENGEWSDYTLVSNPLEIPFKGEEFGEHEARLFIDNYPFVMVSDEEQQKKIQDSMWSQLENKVTERFLIYNIDIDLNCELMNASRFISYKISGNVYHTGDDDRFEDQVEYLYCSTFDRMTGQVINLETAMGVKSAYNQIKDGQYEVVRAEDSVFEKFSNKLLANIYVNDPLFEDDEDHTLDFYIHSGRVYVVIWVGEDNGSYVILKLNEPSRI